MKYGLWIPSVLTLGLLAGCGGSNSYVKKGEVQKSIDHEMDRGRYFEAIGIGAADSSLTDPTQRKATSRNAAIVQAQYEMLSMVKGVQVEGGITVQRAVETDSRLETNINEMIRGAEITKTEWTNNDGCVVTLRLDKKRLEQLMGVKLK